MKRILSVRVALTVVCLGLVLLANGLAVYLPLLNVDISTVGPALLLAQWVAVSIQPRRLGGKLLAQQGRRPRKG